MRRATPSLLRPTAVPPRFPAQPDTQWGYMSIVTAHIDGMSCNHCLNAVQQALAALDGARIESVRMGRAEVEVAAGVTSDDVVSAIEMAGYPVSHVETSG